MIGRQAYENKIDTLEREKLLIAEKVANWGAERHTRSGLFEPAMAFLANPWKVWVSGKLELQRLVLKLAFTEPLAYRRGEGFRTPILSLPFKALGQISTAKMEVARWGGFEPPTP
ncbi:MAG: hypothetical protein AAF376_03985 [Pseudomonadota bacterium]